MKCSPTLFLKLSWPPYQLLTCRSCLATLPSVQGTYSNRCLLLHAEAPTCLKATKMTPNWEGVNEKKIYFYKHRHENCFVLFFNSIFYIFTVTPLDKRNFTLCHFCYENPQINLRLWADGMKRVCWQVIPPFSLPLLSAAVKAECDKNVAKRDTRYC